MAVEVVAHTAPDRRTGFHVQSESLAFMVDGAETPAKKVISVAPDRVPSEAGVCALRTGAAKLPARKAKCKERKIRDLPLMMISCRLTWRGAIDGPEPETK